LFFATAMKLLIQLIFSFFSNKKEAKETNQARSIPFRKLIYSAALKITAYLCFIFLLITINGITFALTIFLTFLFIFTLQYCSKNDRIIKILWKGRSLGSNKVKTFIIGILVLGSILLQPLSYAFMFSLHF
jgi:ABC-type xylose transport system permease subunit